MEEWSKDERLEHEKELLGFYVTGHPLDKFRGLVDSDKFTPLGLIDDLDLRDQRARFPFAGMIRSIEHRTTKSGKPFGILTIEDFTGSCELMCWAESYLPAREAGILEPGKVISLKGAVQVDDRTESRRITGAGLKELKSPQRNERQRAGGVVAVDGPARGAGTGGDPRGADRPPGHHAGVAAREERQRTAGHDRVRQAVPGASGRRPWNGPWRSGVESRPG